MNCKLLCRAFLLDQFASSPGKVSVELDIPNEQQINCRDPEPFLPGNGQRLWGRTTVGVRCPKDRPSTRYFQAYIRVEGDYYVAAHDIAPGNTLTESDVTLQTGDLTRLSQQLLTADNEPAGQVTTRRIGKGMPLQSNMLRAPLLVKSGQQVKVIVQGKGFAIRTDGTALSSAGRNEKLRIRTSEGKLVTGTAISADTVELR
ncbi:flagellar basal body P-ring formation chaperone FlgA [Kushneria phosphatilytica]|uniref:flagellar basal body P-ring formation chaperone FlgA n=1 Tax=Kushneria phosphatilytica TaxID=657387 RepID=UPI0008DA00A1|nr:flagellar basal body P-ring formation chaperone FlgA [Kushneria phosphatilytica]OHV12026.1 flagella basal body P-ring formation protein FlgA [Kushneria phosphatilytica]